jgi:hypothetical protein
LSFQDHFAGYVEQLGKETAVWGLIHAHPRWLAPWEASAEHYATGWRILCADCHPSFDYALSSDGEFSSSGGGGRCATFEVKIERSAILWEAARDRGSWRLYVGRARGEHTSRERFRGDLVAEASDRYAACWRTEDAVVVDHGDRLVVWASSRGSRVVRAIRSRE